MIQILMIHILDWLGWGAGQGSALAGLAHDTLEPIVITLPEPPKHFIEIAAVATVCFIAAWRKTSIRREIRDDSSSA